MKRTVSLLVLVSVLALMSWAFHPIHVSVTEIEFDENEKELEITSRIFIDDLERAIQLHQQNKDFQLLLKAENELDEAIRPYLQKHFSVSLDGKLQKLNYLGHELEDDVLIAYIQVKPVKKWKTIEVLNDAIMEVYDDQSNLVHVTVGKSVKSLRLMMATPSGKITFESK